MNGTYRLTLEVEMEFEAAASLYAHLTGCARDELANARPGFSFSGPAKPCLFTFMRPAGVSIRPVPIPASVPAKQTEGALTSPK